MKASVYARKYAGALALLLALQPCVAYAGPINASVRSLSRVASENPDSFVGVVSINRLNIPLGEMPANLPFELGANLSQKPPKAHAAGHEAAGSLIIGGSHPAVDPSVLIETDLSRPELSPAQGQTMAEVAQIPAASDQLAPHVRTTLEGMPEMVGSMRQGPAMAQRVAAARFDGARDSRLDGAFSIDATAAHVPSAVYVPANQIHTHTRLLPSDLARELSQPTQSRLQKALAQLNVNPKLAAYLKEHFRPSHDWPDRIERLRESLGQLKRLMSKLGVKENTVLSDKHPLTPWLDLGVIRSDVANMEPLAKLGHIFGWEGSLPAAGPSEARRKQLQIWLQKHYQGDSQPLNREIQRLRAYGLTWMHARLAQMLLFLKAVESVQDRDARQRLDNAETIDEDVLADLARYAQDQDSIAGLQLMWEYTLALMMNVDPQYKEDFRRYEEQTVSRLRESVDGLQEKEPAVRDAFLAYYTPSRNWMERFLKVRSIIRVLTPLMDADKNSPIGDNSKISKYTKATVREPGKEHKLTGDGVIINGDFGKIVQWAQEGLHPALGAYRQESRLRKLIWRHRSGNIEPLKAKVRYFFERGVYMEQTLLWLTAYYRAAVLSIPEKFADLRQELLGVTVITSQRLAQLRWLTRPESLQDPEQKTRPKGKYDPTKTGVIKNPTAVARLHYMWELTKLLMIGIPYIDP